MPQTCSQANFAKHVDLTDRHLHFGICNFKE